MNPANTHDLTIVKKNKDDFVARFRNETVLLDKGYIDMELEDEMGKKGVQYLVIKRRNMIKTEREKVHYQTLSKLRRVIETRFSQLEEFGQRFVRAVSRRGLAVKMILSILAFNIHQMMRIIFWELG